jgi:hypothetical protein
LENAYQLRDMKSKSLRSSWIAFLSLTLLSASALLLLTFSRSFSAVDGDSAPWQKQTTFTKRADKGDLYMLGVGKADITGFVILNRPSAH